MISRTLRAQECREASLRGFDLYPTVVDQVSRRGLGRDPARLGGGARDGRPDSHLQRQPDRCLLLIRLVVADAAGTEVRGRQRPYLQSVRRGRERTGTAGSLPLSLALKSGPAISSRPSCGEFVQPRFGKYGRSRWSLERLGPGGADRHRRGRSSRSRARWARSTADSSPGERIPCFERAFTLTESREGRAVTGLVADGRGSGHGVGFCQWGAVGRARAGRLARFWRRTSRHFARATVLSFSHSRRSRMADPVRVGVIGAGAITRSRTCPWRKLKGIEVVAICDTDMPKARAWPIASRCRMPSATSRSCWSEELDAIAICTPNHLHEPHVMAASRRTCMSRRASSRPERRRSAAGPPCSRKEEAGLDGGAQPPVPRRRADRPQLRPERRARESPERSRQLARLPSQPVPARMAHSAR